MRSRVLTGGIKSTTLSNRLQVALPVVLLALLSSFPSSAQDMNKSSSSETTADEQCATNLRRIYKLLRIYLHRSAGVLGFPSNFDLLYGMASDPKPFICSADKGIGAAVKKDSSQTSYEFVNDPQRSDLLMTPPGRIAIVAEKRPNHDGRRYVLFFDGSVRKFNKAQFDTLAKNSFIDKNTIDTSR